MDRTLRVLAMVLVTAGLVMGQGVQTVIFQANMLTSNEVPAVTGLEAAGTGTVSMHLTRDQAGAIVLGVVEFDVNYSITGAAELTGLHIHNGPAGQNAGVIIPTNLSASNPVSHPGGSGRVIRQVVVTDTALLNQIIAQPDQFYINMHSSANPGGFIRGQLSRAEVAVYRGRMIPQNEVPPIPIEASAAAQMVAIYFRDSSGQVAGGTVDFDVTYRFPSSVDLTGLHIHNGPAGVNASVVIGTDLSAINPVSGTTTGRVQRQVPIRTQVQLDNLRGLLVNPAGFYVNLHTSVNPGGVIRSQLIPTGSIRMTTPLETRQEVPVPAVQASGAGTFSAFVTRNAIGQITAGTVIFDVNHQFSGSTEITGLHIHRAAAGVNGGIVIESGVSPSNSVTSASGVGNILRIANVDETTPSALAALNDMVANPGNFYMNLHTTVNPGGVIRGQMGGPPQAPQINARGIVSATNDTTIAAASPGSIISIYGTNLAGAASDTGGTEARSLPIGLNGTDVRIDGRQAPAFFVSPNQINVQVPYETPQGNVQVFVVRGDSFSAPYTLAVSQFSPGVFVTPFGPAVLKNADFSLVTSGNPAAGGDILSIFATGLGAVTPRIASGQFAPIGPIALTLTDPTVTIGGKEAEVLASSLAPGFAGLYQIAIRMPSGVSAGNQPLVVTIGGVRSNTAMMAVK